MQENRVVTFNGTTYPNFGWCVIFAGAGASGKGFVRRNLLPIDGKVINVDDFKPYFAKMRGIDYDPTNPEHTNFVHAGVKNARWKEKVTANVLDPNTHSPERLPNLIFDMTGRDPNNTVVDVAADAREAGYKVMLVWVIANRHEALLRNLQRDRRVPDKVLHTAHNSLATEMPQFLKGDYAGRYLDDAWLVFNSTEGIERSDLEGNEKKTAAVRLERSGNSFVFPSDVEARLQRYLVQVETSPSNPETYLSSDEIAGRYGTPNSHGGYTIDRKATPNFYRHQ